MATTSVGVRLSSEAWARYSAEAQAREMPLAAYLRLRVEKWDQLEAELTALRRAIERIGTGGAGTKSSRGTELQPGVIVEVLLLLRTLAGPQRAGIAQKEVERRGLEVWR